MRYITVDASKVIPWDEAFETEVGQHGKFKTGFGIGSDSVDNPTSVCVAYNAGDRLLEVLNFSHGDSHMGATMGGDRNIVVADKPFALAEDTDCKILGVLKTRQGTQPALYVIDENGDLTEAIGGSASYSGFVSETGAPEEDPKPREVRDNTQQEAYYVNRRTGNAAWGDYYVHVYRLNVNEGQAYPALTLETVGRDMQGEPVIFPKPAQEAPTPPDGGEYATLNVEGVEYYLVPVE